MIVLNLSLKPGFFDRIDSRSTRQHLAVGRQRDCRPDLSGTRTDGVDKLFIDCRLKIWFIDCRRTIIFDSFWFECVFGKVRRRRRLLVDEREFLSTSSARRVQRHLPAVLQSLSDYRISVDWDDLHFCQPCDRWIKSNEESWKKTDSSLHVENFRSQGRRSGK